MLENFSKIDTSYIIFAPDSKSVPVMAESGLVSEVEAAEIVVSQFGSNTALVASPAFIFD